MCVRGRQAIWREGGSVSVCVCVHVGKGEEACVWEGRGGSGPHTSGIALHMHACMLVGLD